MFGITTIFVAGLSVQAELPRLSTQLKGPAPMMSWCREVTQQFHKAVLLTGCEDVRAGSVVRLVQVEEKRGTVPSYAVLIGDDDDSNTEVLWRVMLSKLPSSVHRERFASVEAAKQNTKVNYPRLSKPAVFLCVKKRCSVPIFTTTELSERITAMISDTREYSYEDH